MRNDGRTQYAIDVSTHKLCNICRVTIKGVVEIMEKVILN